MWIDIGCVCQCVPVCDFVFVCVCMSLFVHVRGSVVASTLTIHLDCLVSLGNRLHAAWAGKERTVSVCCCHRTAVTLSELQYEAAM